MKYYVTISLRSRWQDRTGNCMCPSSHSFPSPALYTLYIYRHAFKRWSTCSVTFCKCARLPHQPFILTYIPCRARGWQRGDVGGCQWCGGGWRCRASGGRLGRDLHVTRQARWHCSLAPAAATDMCPCGICCRASVDAALNPIRVRREGWLPGCWVGIRRQDDSCSRLAIRGAAYATEAP